MSQRLHPQRIRAMVLDALSDGEGPQDAYAVAKRTMLTPMEVARVLKMLAQEGFAYTEDEEVSPHILSQAYVPAYPMQKAIAPALHRGVYAPVNAPAAAVPKNAPWRSDTLRSMAKDQPCNLLAVDACLTVDGSTTVGCHRNEGKGMAQKQSDEWMVHGCMHCHEWLDRSGAPRAEKRRAFDAAHALRQVPFWRLAAVDPNRTPGERAAATEALRRLNATPVHPLWFVYLKETSMLDSFGKLLMCILLAVVTWALIKGSFGPKDDTDPHDGRSGLQLLTDAKTGCQYLSRSSGITPRVDASGKHLCNEVKQ